MACWSVENATKAYLKTMKMGKNAKEPDAAEFISALAAGNNAQLMVVACASGSTAGCSTTLALVAAAYQTGGRVVCILPGLEELHLSKQALGNNASHVEFVTGDAQSLLFHDYRQADFVVIDCNLENHEAIIRAMQASGKHDHGTIVLGYNAFCKGLWQRSGSNY
ncbi:hypothetical protein F0562_031348 [Nyssa sinensis]|uniref:Uncharacterized protein n=1 Tax=Nyssa sinensis TaxID=561372 RepID=A0A5J5AXY1_9ASTE|nr:hypothetical protein F0562_031348 [Nyssa sinensis]